MVKIYAKIEKNEEHPGTNLFNQIDELIKLEKVDKIDVDFNKISAIPSIYFSNSIGKLVEKYGLEFIEEKLHLSNYNFQMAGAINLAVNLAIEKRKNKKYMLISTDGYSISNKIIEYCDNPKEVLQEEFNKHKPSEDLDENCAEMSFVNDFDAMLYKNGEEVLVWRMVKIG